MSPRPRPSFSNGRSRRRVLRACVAAATGLVVPTGVARAAAPVVEIRMLSRELGAHVSFDPVGILVRSGTTIRWIVEADVHTTTAYHPANNSHPLRIPELAQPWASDYLINPGDSFEVTLTVEGVYDYFCAPHEIAGMVGRIIVGKPTGPGALPFDYFAGDPAKASWATIPEAARERFPPIELILSKGAVPAE